jgi:hypothetical protein
MKHERQEQFTLVQQMMRLDEAIGSYADSHQSFTDKELGLIHAYAEYCLESGYKLRTNGISKFVPTDFSKVNELKTDLQNSGSSYQKMAGLQERGRGLSEMSRGFE